MHFNNKLIRFLKFHEILNVYLSLFTQDNEGQIGVLCDIEHNGNLMRVDITENLGGFQPEHLVYFTNLQCLDMSGCPEIEPATFVDCIGHCPMLVQIDMRGCIQFTEKMIVKILNRLLLLKYIDCTSCVPLTYASAFNILAPLHDLMNINFEPNFPQGDFEAWKSLVRTFKFVKFGVSVMSIFPNYGMHIRSPLYDFSDEE